MTSGEPTPADRAKPATQATQAIPPTPPTPPKPPTPAGIFLRFLRVGAFTVGGGYAMVPIIRHELVESARWMDDRQFSDILLIAQTAPGPIAVNAALLAGYRLSGAFGAAAGVLGTIIAPFGFILAIAMFLRSYLDVPAVVSALAGVRVAVVALMAAAAWRILARRHDAGTIAAAGVLLAVLAAGVNPFLVVFGSIVVGGLAGIFTAKREGEDDPR